MKRSYVDKRVKKRKHQGTWPSNANYYGHGGQCKILIQRDLWLTRGAYHTRAAWPLEKTYFILYKTLEGLRKESLLPWLEFEIEKHRKTKAHTKDGGDQELIEDPLTFRRGTHQSNRVFFFYFYFYLLMFSLNSMGCNSNMSE